MPARSRNCIMSFIFRIMLAYKNNKRERRRICWQHNDVDGLRANYVWFFVFDLTCADLWSSQFIVGRGTKLLAVSLKEWFTSVSIVCLSISTSGHFLQCRSLYKCNLFALKWESAMPGPSQKLVESMWNKSLKVHYATYKAASLEPV
jgi:hypothetical protein